MFLDNLTNITLNIMSRLKELRYFTLVMLLCGFIAAGTLNSCREEKKKENTEAQEEHPESEEHPTEDAAADEEHPAKDGEEHPAKEGEEEHPEKEGE